MTIKEFLNDVRRQHSRVQACKERLAEIEMEVISLKSPQSGTKSNPIARNHSTKWFPGSNQKERN